MDSFLNQTSFGTGYAGKDVVESIKTITWRYVCCAEQFQGDDASARNDFRQTLKLIAEQNREVCQALTVHLDGQQFTSEMEQMASGLYDGCI
ncbi:SLATT domain-containing protein [Atlantibacter sp.]|uniref:SLATT domain-containing protein n=1 Tax=Atlantibacter sp. TaxID=1903473 RepID=UPI0028AE7B2A|nr:SLATT domain-containing protein [Atlantibacter sp.]